MSAIRVTIVLLLLSGNLIAQEPANNNKSNSVKSSTDSSFNEFLKMFSDTTYNFLNYDFDELFFTDSATFKKAFTTLSDKFGNDFEALKDDWKEATFLGNNYTIKGDNLPSTSNNYITYYDTLFGQASPPEYVAEIDTAVTQFTAASDIKKWKKLLIKVFPREARHLTETGNDEGPKASHEIIFLHPANRIKTGWKLILRNYHVKGKQWVELGISELY